MKLLRKRDIPEERYTNAFLGYGPEDSHFVIELTYSKPPGCSFFFFFSFPHILMLNGNTSYRYATSTWNITF